MWNHLFHTLACVRLGSSTKTLGSRKGEFSQTAEKNIFLQPDIAGRPIVFSGKWWLSGQVSACIPGRSWCPAHTATPKSPPSSNPHSQTVSVSGTKPAPRSLPGIGTVIHPMVCCHGTEIHCRETVFSLRRRPSPIVFAHSWQNFISSTGGINWVNIEERKKEHLPSHLAALFGLSFSSKIFAFLSSPAKH